LTIRDVRPAEMEQVGELRVAAYRAGGFMSEDSEYAATLRALGTAGDGQVLVAVAGDRIVGTAMLQPWPHAGQVVRTPDEAEIRALAVAPDQQRTGIGRDLVAAVIERAIEAGVRHLVLFTQPDMRAARRMYEGFGFLRLPERDWAPAPGVLLLAYGLPLTSDPVVR
jgi:ribosomal protein S18 acetylase RimI-like enzyme